MNRRLPTGDIFLWFIFATVAGIVGGTFTQTMVTARYFPALPGIVLISAFIPFAIVLLLPFFMPLKVHRGR